MRQEIHIPNLLFKDLFLFYLTGVILFCGPNKSTLVASEAKRLLPDKFYIVKNDPVTIRTHSKEFGKLNGTSKYTVSFMAKGSRNINLYLEVYFKRFLPPYLTQPSPGFIPFEVKRGWQTYNFTFQPNEDFFNFWEVYPEVFFVILPSVSLPETVWIKDLYFTQDTIQQLTPNFVSGKLPFLRLTPSLDGKVLIDVFPDNIVDTCKLQILGVAMLSTKHPREVFTKEGDVNISEPLLESIGRLKIPFTRIFIPIMDTNDIREGALRLKRLITLFEIPPERVVLELEPPGQGGTLSPTLWAKAVEYIINEIEPRFHLWEVGNETYFVPHNIKKKGIEPAYPTALDYAEHVKRVSEKIKEVQPNAKVGISLSQNYLAWNNTVLREAKGYYDFVAPHYYAALPYQTYNFEDIVLTENAISLLKTLSIQTLIEKYDTSQRLFQLVTEWAKNSRTTNEKRPWFVSQNGNMLGTLHRAVRLIYYLREGMVDGAASWNLFGKYKRRGKRADGFHYLFIDKPTASSLLYQMHYLFRKHVGKYIVKFRGKAPFYESRKIDSELIDFAMPYTPVIVTTNLTRDSIFIILVNASYNKTFKVNIHFESTTAFKLSGKLLTDSRSNFLDRSGLIEDPQNFIKRINVIKIKPNNFAFSIAPHSIAYLTGTMVR